MMGKIKRTLMKLKTDDLIKGGWIRTAGHLPGKRGINTGTFFLCSSYPNLLSIFLFSIRGMLTVKKRTVIAIGPIIVHQYAGAAAKAKIKSPHQNVTSPK
jgi:hypothetical protein